MKKEQVEKYLFCGCLRRKHVSIAERKFKWLAGRSKRILKQKRSDNFFVREQGYQGEP